MLKTAEQHLLHLSHLPFHADLVGAVAVELQKRGDGRGEQSPADRVNALLEKITDGNHETPL